MCSPLSPLIIMPPLIPPPLLISLSLIVRFICSPLPPLIPMPLLSLVVTCWCSLILSSICGMTLMADRIVFELVAAADAVILKTVGLKFAFSVVPPRALLSKRSKRQNDDCWFSSCRVVWVIVGIDTAFIAVSKERVLDLTLLLLGYIDFVVGVGVAVIVASFDNDKSHNEIVNWKVSILDVGRCPK